MVWMILSGVFLLSGLFLPLPETGKLVLLFAAYLSAGWRVLFHAARNILRGKFFDEEFLMAVASLGALALWDVAEAAGVMLFYCVGEWFQDLAVDRSRRSITQLMDIRPDEAGKLVNGVVQICPAESIVPGDFILVKAGERIALDGIVTDGASQLDTAALTGESMPREVFAGEAALAGCVNLSGTITLRVTKAFGESTAAKILELVENASEHKAPAEQFITKFAHFYTPIVVGLAVLLAVVPPLLGLGTWGLFLSRALVFLVISCPCALVISVPMGFFAGIGCASKNGILVKGGNYLEALAHAQLVAFDKTGTLTQGKFRVLSVCTADISEEMLLDYAAHAELRSTHPIAQSLRAAYEGRLDETRLGASRELPGGGIETTVDGHVVLAGNLRFMVLSSVSIPEAVPEGTAIFLAVDGIYAGLLLIGDAPKPEAKEALAALKNLGVTKTVMLTGDHPSAGFAMGEQVGVDEVYAELLPDGKVEKLQELLSQNGRQGKVLYIGDGMNDAPVLALADIGIAMGGLGTDAAIEAADIVIMDDDLRRLPQAISIARNTRKIVTQNIVFAIAVKVLFLTLGSFGQVSMWGAVFADVGVALLCVLNAMRVLNTKI